MYPPTHAHAHPRTHAHTHAHPHACTHTGIPAHAQADADVPFGVQARRRGDRLVPVQVRPIAYLLCGVLVQCIATHSTFTCCPLAADSKAPLAVGNEWHAVRAAFGLKPSMRSATVCLFVCLFVCLCARRARQLRAQYAYAYVYSSCKCSPSGAPLWRV